MEDQIVFVIREFFESNYSEEEFLYLEIIWIVWITGYINIFFLRLFFKEYNYIYIFVSNTKLTLFSDRKCNKHFKLIINDK